MDFKYDRAKIDLVKSLKGRWSRSKKCWYVPDNTHFRTLFGMEIPPVGKGVLSKLSPLNARELQRMKEVLQMKAYSPSTIKTYMIEFAQLLYILKDVPVDSLGYDRLRAYILYCINTLKISESQLHSSSTPSNSILNRCSINRTSLPKSHGRRSHPLCQRC